ncbi:MAG: DNA methyltransferase, partial [Candidatus Dadabacteria bacterium]|nr:DNA methyltransferase [Candidatus Dadabacteria bacterium]
VIETAGQVYDKGMKSYLIMMAIRLIEMRRILKPTGSIYLHCDPTASHYLKLLMDTVFNKENFRNEVVWCYKGPSNSKKNFPRKHDYILFYAVSDQTKFNSNAVRVGYSESFLQRRKHNEGSAGITKGYAESRTINEVKEQFGKGKVVEDFWTDIPSGGQISKKERTGYPTQKPLALLERIISASSNPGDLVLDPFCGCATALIAAERLGRRWIGIDLSEKALELVKVRMERETTLFEKFSPIHRTDIPKREGKRSKNIKTVLYGKQGGNCNLCKVHFLNVNLTVDHIVPRKHGGLDDDDNLQLLCQRCNSIKGTRTMQEAKARYNRAKP